MKKSRLTPTTLSLIGVIVAILVLLFGNNIIGRFLNKESKNEPEKNQIEQNYLPFPKKALIKKHNQLLIDEELANKALLGRPIKGHSKTYYVDEFIQPKYINKKTHIRVDSIFMTPKLLPKKNIHYMEPNIDIKIEFDRRYPIEALDQIEVMVISKWKYFYDNRYNMNLIEKKFKITENPIAFIQIENSFEPGTYYLIYGYNLKKANYRFYYHMTKFEIIE